MLEVRSSYLELVAGRIEEVDGEYVATHFLAPFAFPLFPQRCLYIRGEASEGRRQMVHTGQSIPLVWKSVVLGYLRVWLAWAAFSSPFWLMWGERVDFGRPEWLVTLGLFGAWIFTLVVPGRLSKRERAERQALFRATGMYLHPRRLGRFELEERTGELEETLTASGLDTTPDALRDAATSADEALARRIFAYGRYAAAFTGDRAFDAAADAAFARIG